MAQARFIDVESLNEFINSSPFEYLDSKSKTKIKDGMRDKFEASINNFFLALSSDAYLPKVVEFITSPNVDPDLPPEYASSSSIDVLYNIVEMIKLYKPDDLIKLGVLVDKHAETIVNEWLYCVSDLDVCAQAFPSHIDDLMLQVTTNQQCVKRILKSEQSVDKNLITKDKTIEDLSADIVLEKIETHPIFNKYFVDFRDLQYQVPSLYHSRR